jgi:uncharacterized protein (TIGR00369 family)
MIDRLRQIADSAPAPLVKSLGLQIVSATRGEVTLTLPVVPHVVHSQGVLCGQAIMAAMDFAMVLAIAANEEGTYRPMTTVQLQTSFLRGVPADSGEVKLVARVLRAGSRLIYGEILLTTPDGKLAAHGTTTYAFVPDRRASAST